MGRGGVEEERRVNGGGIDRKESEERWRRKRIGKGEEGRRRERSVK